MQREARYGQHTYEMDPMEAFDDEGDVHPGQAIELSPVVVIAPISGTRSSSSTMSSSRCSRLRANSDS